MLKDQKSSLRRANLSDSRIPGELCPDEPDFVAKAMPGLLYQGVQFEWLFAPEPPVPPDQNWLRVGARQVRLCSVRNRRARRYLLRLRPDGAARVTIPRGGSPAVARQFVERHAAWLERELQRLQAQPRKPAVWQIGTEILLRGNAVRIEAGT